MDGNFFSTPEPDTTVVSIMALLEVRGVTQSRALTLPQGRTEIPSHTKGGVYHHAPVELALDEQWRVELSDNGYSAAFELVFSHCGSPSTPVVIEVKDKGVGPEPTASSQGIELGDVRISVIGADDGYGGMVVRLVILCGDDAPSIAETAYQTKYDDSSASQTRTVIVTVQRKGVSGEPS